MSVRRITFLGLPLDVNISTSDIWQGVKSGENTFATLMGPEAWTTQKAQPTFQHTLNKLSLVISSSLIVSTLAHYMTKERINALSFETPRLVRNFFAKVAESKRPIAIVGGRPRDDEDALAMLQSRFKGLNVVATAHGYGEFAPKISVILEKKPEIILVAMKTPLQEEFLVALKEAGFKGFALGCGDFIENFIVTKDYFNKSTLLDRWNLLPLYKIYKSPGRALKYYVAQYKDFLSLVFQDISGRVLSTARSLRRRFTEAV